MGFFSPEIGIDLGTNNVLFYVADKGIVLREPGDRLGRRKAHRAGRRRGGASAAGAHAAGIPRHMAHSRRRDRRFRSRRVDAAVFHPPGAGRKLSGQAAHGAHHPRRGDEHVL